MHTETPVSNNMQVSNNSRLVTESEPSFQISGSATVVTLNQTV